MGLLRIVATGLGVVCALGAVLAQGGRWSGALDVLTHFAPLYLAGAIVVLVTALFTPQRLGSTRLALMGGLAAVGSLLLIVPELLRPASPGAPADAPRRLKVIQFNAEHDNADIAATARWIAAEDPDVLVLEDGTPALQAAIQRRLRRTVLCGLTCNVRIFTRATPVRVERPRRGRYGQGPAIAVAHFGAGDGGYSVVGVHYVWPTKFVTHAENTRRMLQIVDPLPRGRLILAGDFNSSPWSFARRREDALLRVERRTRAMFSWPATGLGVPVLPIDHIYAGPDWKTVRIARGPRLGSDHYPIVAVLALAPKT